MPRFIETGGGLINLDYVERIREQTVTRTTSRGETSTESVADFTLSRPIRVVYRAGNRCGPAQKRVTVEEIERVVRIT
jgi:hypothetical protein